MKIRHEYITIACVFLLVLAVFEIFLLRSAIQVEINSRRNQQFEYDTRLAVLEVKYLAVYNSQRTCFIEMNRNSVQLASIKTLMNDLKFFPVIIRDKNLKRVNLKDYTSSE